MMLRLPLPNDAGRPVGVNQNENEEAEVKSVTPEDIPEGMRPARRPVPDPLPEIVPVAS